MSQSGERPCFVIPAAPNAIQAHLAGLLEHRDAIRVLVESHALPAFAQDAGQESLGHLDRFPAHVGAVELPDQRRRGTPAARCGGNYRTMAFARTHVNRRGLRERTG